MPQEPSKDVLSEDGGIHKKLETADTFLPRKSYWVAVTWYTNLEPSRVHSWKDLMVAFVGQYQYNSDMALNRLQLQNMCKKGHESFKEYAQKWRDLAAQVAPPMTKREMIIVIIDTLPVFYYEKWWATHLQALLI